MRTLITVVALCTSAVAGAQELSAIDNAVDHAKVLLDTRVRDRKSVV